MLIRPSTAFTLSGTRKRPRMHKDSHLAWIRTLPCVVGGEYGVEAAHIRYGSLPHGKRETGKSEKPDDCWSVPLAPDLHRLQHSMNERTFWERYGIDPLVVAALLYLASGDDERGLLIIQHAREFRP